MSITSPAFVVFTVLALLCYYGSPRALQNHVLLAASYIFYATWSPWLCMSIAVTTLATFAIGSRVARGDNRSKAWMWTGMSMNLILLAASKILQADRILPAAAGIAGIATVATVGIAFYTLNCISYLVDATHTMRRVRPALHEFALYLAFFPKLLAGPLERADGFVLQLRSARVVDARAQQESVYLIGTGIARKFLFAGPLGAFVLGEKTELPLAVWLVTFVFYVYNDFAAYSDLARGIALSFGIRLTENFNAPFFATNFGDFWIRWHHSFSMWLRDYVYLPSARVLLKRNGNRPRATVLIVPALATMFASALWHALNVRFLLWGAALGGLIVLDQIRKILVRRFSRLNVQPAPLRIAAPFLVVGLFACAALPFAPETVAGGKVDSRSLEFIAVLLCCSLLMDRMRVKRDRAAFMRNPVVAGVAVALLLFALIASVTLSVSAPFVYQGF